MLNLWLGFEAMGALVIVLVGFFTVFVHDFILLIIFFLSPPLIFRELFPFWDNFIKL